MTSQPTEHNPSHQPDAADLASAKRVLALHQKYPDKSRDELVDLLIRNSCLQVAGRSAVTAGAVALPTLGMIASLAVGTIANNMNNTHQSQAETVLDIATVYGYRFQPNEKPYYLAVVLGLQSSNPAQAQRNNQGTNQSGAEQLLAKGGQQLANQATQRLARSSIGRALPVVNVTRAAGSNLLMTYAAGQRAKTYIKSGPASVGDMESSISTLLKSDELKLSEWTMESISASMANLSDTLIEGFDQGAQDVGRAAGKATRKFLNFWRDATTPKR